MIKAFVTGWPISHSLSPQLHRFWLDRYGIEGDYQAIAVEPAGFAEFLTTFEKDGYVGGNVTIPHKEAAFELCQRLSSRATNIGAVNTVWRQDGALCGENTDIYGFLASLDQAAGDWDKTEAALVLGAGGAARSVIHGLIERGISRIVLANRTVEKANRLAAMATDQIEVIPWAKIASTLPEIGLIVNTTSLGMKGQPELPIDLSAARPGTVVNDLVYNPIETQLLRQATRLGLTPVDGLSMLMHQAAPGFHQWFGTKPEVDASLRAHLLLHLSNREKQ